MGLMIPAATGAFAGSASRSRGYDRAMPMYEFHCGACDQRFEALVSAGTDSLDCRICAAPEATRVFSAQAAPFGVVQSVGQARKRERANALLHSNARAEFKTKREQARKGKGADPGDRRSK